MAYSAASPPQSRYSIAYPFHVVLPPVPWFGPNLAPPRLRPARARWIEAVAFTDSLWQEQLGSCEAALEASGLSVNAFAAREGADELALVPVQQMLREPRVPVPLRRLG